MAGLGWHRCLPSGLEPRPDFVIGDILEAGQFVGKGTHVATTLHVVLATDRHESRAVPAQVPGEQRQVDEGEYVVGCVVMLGDAEGPADLGCLGGRVVMGDIPDDLGWDTGDVLGPIQRPLVDGRRVGIEAAGGMGDEAVVRQPSVDDFAANGVGQGDVGTDVDAEPHVGPLGRSGTSRIDGVHLGAIAHAFEKVMEEDRVGFAGIRPPQQDQIGRLDLFI